MDARYLRRRTPRRNDGVFVSIARPFAVELFCCLPHVREQQLPRRKYVSLSVVPSSCLICNALALTLAACAPWAAPCPPRRSPSHARCRPAAAPVAVATPALPAAPHRRTGHGRARSLFPLTLKDDLGREVSLAARPARIVSLAPSNTEILFAVGRGPTGRGRHRSSATTRPRRKQGREVVGRLLRRVAERREDRRLKPDLVFADGTPHRPVSDALEAAGVHGLQPGPEGLRGRLCEHPGGRVH